MSSYLNTPFMLNGKMVKRVQTDYDKDKYSCLNCAFNKQWRKDKKCVDKNKCGVGCHFILVENESE